MKIREDKTKIMMSKKETQQANRRISKFIEKVEAAHRRTAKSKLVFKKGEKMDNCLSKKGNVELKRWYKKTLKEYIKAGKTEEQLVEDVKAVLRM